MQQLRQLLPPDQINLVIYHTDCSDGTAAALAAQLKLGARAKYFGVKHLEDGRVDPNLMKYIQPDSKILIVDFSYSRKTLLNLKQYVAAIIVLDHHISAQKELSDLDFCYFDLAHSGCALAWNYFWPEMEMPKCFAHIEDRDIWKWTVPGSHEFCAALYNTMPIGIESYKQLLEYKGDRWLDSNMYETLLQKGKYTLEFTADMTNKICRYAKVISSKNGKTVALVDSSEFVSDVGNQLAKTSNFALVFYYDFERFKYKISARSVSEDNRCDLLAKTHFSGGGHKCASGFYWDGTIPALMEKIRNIEL